MALEGDMLHSIVLMEKIETSNSLNLAMTRVITLKKYRALHVRCWTDSR